MPKTFKQKAESRIFEHLYNTQTPVRAEITKGLFNYRCFENAIQYAHENPGAEVIMGIITENGVPILHFWNKLDGVHLETTLGYRAKNIFYYPMRTIAPEQYDIVHRIFDEALDYWFITFTKWWERPFINPKRIT